MNKLVVILVIFAGLVLSCKSPQEDQQAQSQITTQPPNQEAVDPVDADTIEVGTVKRTAAEWHQILSSGEFEILRKAGTESPFDNKYVNNKTEGIYYCGGCGLPVYSSNTKFHSGTGWPSFWAPIDPKLVKRQQDNSKGMSRIEVVCAQCGSHFGHIFPNSTVPSGERHCLNSLALDFKAQKL